MSELADEADSKSVGGNVVWVQVPLPASYKKPVNTGFFLSLFHCLDLVLRRLFQGKRIKDRFIR